MKKNFVLLLQLFLSAVLFFWGATAQAQTQIVIWYESPGTYSGTVPTGATSITGQVWGGGGGGGGFYSGGASGEAKAGGGGGGAFAQKTHNSGGYPVSVVVGVGGSRGVGDGCGGDGGPGGNSSFDYNGINTVAGGGGNGGYSTSLAAGCGENSRRNGPGGAGGTFSGADQGWEGQAGTNGDNGGRGGASGQYGGAQTGTPGKNADGINGNIIGGGGSGSHGNAFFGEKKPGGTGARGEARVIFYWDVATPEIAGSNSYLLCQGHTLTLSVANPITDGGIIYQWRRNGIPCGQGTSFTISNATIADQATYTVSAIYSYTFSGSRISVGGSDISGNTLSGESSQSEGVTITIGPYYTVEITAEGPGEAWFLNPGNQDDRSLKNYPALCGSSMTTQIDIEKYGIYFHFTGYYTSDGVPLSTDPNYTFTLTDNTSIVAKFDTNTHIVEFVAVREDGTPAPELGSTTGSGIYKHFNSVTGTAIAAENCEFVGWRDAITGDPVSAEIESLLGDVKYEAVFREIKHNVTTSSNIAGGITKGDSIYSQFIETEQAKVEAFPDYGFIFKGWEVFIDGNPQSEIITDNPYIFLENNRIMNSYHFNAIFDTSVYTVTVSGTNGSTTGAGEYKHNRIATLSATANEGYHFVEWQSNGVQLGTEPTLTFNVWQDTSINAVFEINTYAVNVSIQGNGNYSPEASQAGTYEHFSEFNLNAIPQAKHEFRFWIINDDTVSYNNPEYRITIDGEKNIIGVFTPTRKEIIVTAEPSVGGTVTGAGKYEHGSYAEVSATAFYGFTFTHFTASSNESSEDAIIYDNPIIITSLEDDISFVAHFSRNNYWIEGDVATRGGGVSLETQDNDISAKQYPYQSNVTLYANNDSIHNFLHWSDREGNIVSTENPLNVLVERDTIYIAHFAPKQFSISVLAVPAGITKVLGSGIYNALDTARLSFVSNKNARFDGWSEDGASIFSTDTVFEFVVVSNRNIYAMFTPIVYSLDVVTNADERGTASGGGKFFAGKNTRLLATANYGYDFLCWLRDGDTLSFANPYYPVIRAEDDIVTAVFVPHNFSLTVIDFSGTSSSKVPYMENIEVSAEMPYGYDFAGWKATGNSDAAFNLTITKDTLFEAVYTPRNYNISATAENGSVLGAGEYAYGTVARLTAQAVSEKYVFSHWENSEGIEIATSLELQMTVGGNAEYKAVFIPAPMSIRILSLLDETTIGIEEIPARYLDIKTISADNITGLKFKHWRSCCTNEIITDNKELELQVLSDTSVCAIYEVIRYSLHLSANPQEAGSIEALGAGFSQTDHGKSVTLNAQANYGYTFKYYTNNTGRVLSYDPNYSFKVYSDDTIIAQFTPNTYKITVVSTTPKLGSVKGTKTAVYGSTVDVKAWTTAEGYEFAYWTNEDGDIISSDAELSVKVDRDKTVFAYFAQSNYELLLTVNGEMFQTVGGYALIDGVHKYPVINDKFMSVHRINAYPHYGYYFAGWKENEKIISTDTQTDITLDRNRVIDAVFSPYSYQLTLFSNISEALLYGAGTYYYSANANIRVEAPKNYNFIAWLDENNDTISKSSTLALNIIENTSLKAIFEERKHSIVLLENIAGAAALLQGEGTYHYNLQTVLSTEANEGYKFLRWESKKSVLSPQASFSYRVISDDTITAVFERVQHNINAGVSIVEGGRVSFTSNTFNIGETVSISATENHHYHFLYWTENNEIVCREKVYEFVADKDINLVAHFEINRYRVNVVSNPENVATLKGTGVYNALTTVTVEAGKPVGYGFIAWINEFGDTLTHEHSFSFEVDDNTVLTAVYNSDFVTIDLVAKEGGRVMGGGIIPKGADTFIVAIPNAGYAFEHWTNDKNEIVSKQEEIHFVAEKDARYTAHFILADPLPAAKLIAYPNPIKTNFHIVSDKKGTIQIMDIKGAVLYSEPIDGFKVTFDCTMLAAGTYLYRFISDDGSKPVVGKFIKQ